MCCSTIICCDIITLDPCSTEFILFLDETDELFWVSIKMDGKNTITFPISLVNKRLVVPFSPSEFNVKKIEIRIKDSKNFEIPIRFGEGCVLHCGLTFEVSSLNATNFLNRSCAEEQGFSWSIPVNTYNWEIPVNNYSWLLTNLTWIDSNGELTGFEEIFGGNRVHYISGQSGNVLNYNWVDTDLKKLVAGRFFITISGSRDIYPEEITSFGDYNVEITLNNGATLQAEDIIKIVSI